MRESCEVVVLLTIKIAGAYQKLMLFSFYKIKFVVGSRVERVTLSLDPICYLYFASDFHFIFNTECLFFFTFSHIL